MKKHFTVDGQAMPFATKKEACSYARTASLMYGESAIVVRYDGFAVETFKQGTKAGLRSTVTR